MASVPPLRSTSSNLRGRLLKVTDSVPQTRRAGVVFIAGGRMQRLRAPGPNGISAVFELRSRPIASAAWSRAGPVGGPLLRSQASAAREKRTVGTSPGKEWMSLGLNCGGAALAWIGVVGMGALAPVTGGASGFAAAFLYAGALASTGQCAVSTFRTANVYTGRGAINKKLDDDKVYVWTMRAADGIGLLGAAGALKELKVAHTALSSQGFTWSRAASSSLARPARRQLTTALGVQTAKRFPGPVINRYVRQRLLDGVGGVVGLTASASDGIIKDMVVWVIGVSNEED